MSRRLAAWLAWGSLACSLALVAGAVLLQTLNAISVRLHPTIDATAGYGAIFLGFAAVGTFIAVRRPEHPIGWLFCLVSLPNALWAFAMQYAIYTVVTHAGALPGAELALSLANGWIGNPGWGLLLVYMPLLFPTGRPPSPRWRPFMWLFAAILLLDGIVWLFMPGAVREEGLLASQMNPFGWTSAGPALRWLAPAIQLIYIPFMLASVAAVVIRWRRAGAVERLQLKWFVFATALIPALIIVGMGSDWLAIPGRDWIVVPMSMSMILAFPVAVGVAILRYRLYDIDLIIRKTLVYAVVTGVLTAAYFGAVVLLQALFVRLTGQESALAVVASTLAIAALFGPLRARVQELIDRRFFRTKYDARLVLESFAIRASAETDLDALAADLVGTIRATMQPEHVRLWLPPPERVASEERKA
jgi:hypothetical protein